MRSFVLMILIVAGFSASLSRGDESVAPSADGTLVDGDGFGLFDGVADAADWIFNESSYEGAITLYRSSSPNIEHRLVFEFNLNSITSPPPVVAVLRFTLRGAPRFPAETAVVQVLAYPSDLAETLADFSMGPATFMDQVYLAAFQDSTSFEVNISDPVNAALQSTSKRVAFRFQLESQTQSAQAFLDAIDTEPATKPRVVVLSTIPGDLNGDGQLDRNDHSKMVSCLSGPGVLPAVGCSVCDFSGDADVDLQDLRTFDLRYTLYGE